MDSLATLIALVAFVSMYLVYRSLHAPWPSAPLPPGPKPLPLIGNLLVLPVSRPWATFSKWGDIYGRIVHVNALGQSIVILNDPKYTVDMLDKKSLLYSDCPTLIMGGQIVGWEEGPALSPFCDRWSECLMSHFMDTKAKVDAFNHVIQEETNVLLKQFLLDSSNWVQHQYFRQFLNELTVLMGLMTRLGGGYISEYL
ncbi:hypothetical protein C8Q74DRAFT_1365995 [Fomes fomentarius]|nr:hypothetical protein C8Q74DRAFT_1365995 [Fomes fomentarius]